MRERNRGRRQGGEVGGGKRGGRRKTSRRKVGITGLGGDWEEVKGAERGKPKDRFSPVRKAHPLTRLWKKSELRSQCWGSTMLGALSTLGGEALEFSHT